MLDVAQQFADRVKRLLFEQPKIVGDKSRLHLHKSVTLEGWCTVNLLCGDIHIGEKSFLGQNCMLIAAGYGHDILKRFDERGALTSREGQDILIGKGVFICSGAIILGPCKIGDHAVIAAGSVVLPGEYEAESLYAGNPAVFKKYV